MDKTERFFELKELWKKSDEAHRVEIDKEISELLAILLSFYHAILLAEHPLIYCGYLQSLV